MAMAAASLAVVALPTDRQALAQETAVEITRAEWRSGDRELRVEGRNRTRSALTVTNANPAINQTLGSGGTREEWRVRVSNPSPVPCRVKATTAGGQSAERNVRDAPANCDGGVTPPPGGGNPPPQSNKSINSTSQNSASVPATPVPEQPIAGLSGFQVFAVNDLGMHCGDLDTRVASILPPFNVVHAQVVRKGSQPERLGEEQVILEYSAASNPNDPVLSNPGAILDPNFTGVYKTNFWDNGRALHAYGPFYPALNDVVPGADPSGTRSLLEVFLPENNSFDLGLPVPDLELLYLTEPPSLVADQQSMPAETFRNPATGAPLTGRTTNPFVANAPQRFQQFVGTQAFFTNPAFKFGYTAPVEWHEAAGVPIATFDDRGRENAYPLMRVQAKAAPGNSLGVSSGTVLSSVDTVLPVSGEADCRACHAAPVDGGNGSGTQALVTAGIALKTSLDDNEFVSGDVPLPVAVEWATDHNILALHNLKHPETPLTPPVVCQTCHYTPALDLAQVGPQDTTNGRAQVRHNTKTMSNVMHASHARLAQGKTDDAGNPLFPAMPSPVGRNRADAQSVLENTCYLCHPGKRTQCLRGAMGQAGVVCQDCHGDMKQVGTDFSKDRPAGGGFILAADFYTNPNTPRVPWANEPGCGSCHTGDVRSNGRPTPPAGQSYVAAPDGIRLLQAFRSGDPKATPIVPTNNRFAENLVTTAENSQGAAGNPKLYRVSTGHGGMFCEACHGSTHAEWSSNPVATKVNANDNVTSNQIQGHAGTIVECQTCHGNAMNSRITLDGPHGMHPVGDQNGNRFVDGGHEDLAERNPNACRACHGNRGEGTVLSMTKADRRFEGRTFPKGTAVGCGICHENELR